MANIKTITKKLAATGKYSEYELSLMTEKEIRETFKTVKEGNQEDKAMKNEQVEIATVNNETVVKEEIAMETLFNALKDNQKTSDAGYIKKDELKEILKGFGLEFNRKATRTEMVDTFMNMYKDSKRVEDEVAYGNVIVEEKKEVQTMNNENTMNIPVPVVVNSTPVAPISIQVGDGDVQDRIYPELNPELTPVKTAPVKIQNAAPVDAKVKTYNLMHLIGDHALDQKKKGYGTCISAYMVCAYIMQVEYGIKNLKNWMGKHEVTDEMKATVKKVRNWLIEKGYLVTATFKDEKDFSFFTPEYDGQGSSKMYDATKYQATGNKTTTTYRVTKEMNKWYQK